MTKKVAFKFDADINFTDVPTIVKHLDGYRSGKKIRWSEIEYWASETAVIEELVVPLDSGAVLSVGWQASGYCTISGNVLTYFQRVYEEVFSCDGRLYTIKEIAWRQEVIRGLFIDMIKAIARRRLTGGRALDLLIQSYEEQLAQLD